MLRPEFLAMIRCPENRTPLAEAAPDVLDKINTAIRAGQVSNRAGQKVERPIDSGLVRQDGRVVYPVYDDMPVLLVDEGIELGQLAG